MPGRGLRARLISDMTTHAVGLALIHEHFQLLLYGLEMPLSQLYAIMKTHGNSMGHLQC